MVAYRYKSPPRVGSRGELNTHTATCKRSVGKMSPWGGIPAAWRNGAKFRVTADYARICNGTLRQILKDAPRPMRPSVEVAPGVRRRAKRK